MILVHCMDDVCGKGKAWATHENFGKANRNNPMDFVHGNGNGKNRHGLTPASLA